MLRAMNEHRARVVGPRDGKQGALGAIGVRLVIEGADSGGGFALVEHPMPPRSLAAPLHRHTHEDEYSYVLEGRLGALLGDLEQLGLVYYDDFFELSGNWPEWLHVRVASR